jgi:hypothetical protein
MKQSRSTKFEYTARRGVRVGHLPPYGAGKGKAAFKGRKGPANRVGQKRQWERAGVSRTGQSLAIAQLTSSPTRHPEMTSATLCNPYSMPTSLEW